MKQKGHLTNPEIEKALQGLDKDKPKPDDAGKFPVLIVDDDKWIHRVLAHYLRSWGFNPISAFDAIDGIAMATKFRPLLILLDIIMPEIKGDLVLKILKRIEITQNIPVIVISGNLNTEVLGNTYKSGAAGFLSKPITQQILEEKVTDCLGPAIFTQLKPEATASS